MDFMFQECTNFNQPLNWDLTKVKTSYMFDRCGISLENKTFK
jgi:hypothetical protein